MTSTQTVLSTGTWTADAVHSDISFKVRHMAVGKARGDFDLKSATLTVGDGGFTDTKVVAEIDAASVETNNDQRNAHVQSPDFLDIANHPTITFVSTEVRDFDGENFVLVGDLTIRGVTKQIVLSAEFLGQTVDAYGLTRAGFSATGSLNRREYGVNFTAAFGASNAVVADKVEISLELEFTLDQAEQAN